MKKAKVYKILRIACSVVAALALAACAFIFVYLGTVWGIASIVGAGTFFALTVLFKKLQEDAEEDYSALSKQEDGQSDSTLTKQ